MAPLRDTRGRVITRKIISRSMFLSLIGGGGGSVWFLFSSPQQILTILLRNYLDASSLELGLFLGILNFASIMHLSAIFIYARRSTIKPYWITIGFIHRSFSFVIAAAAFYAASGGDPYIARVIIMVSSVLTFLVGNSAGAGWWAWMNELIPSASRASYFGRRSALAQSMNVAAFFTASMALDYFSVSGFVIFGAIYAVSGVLGVFEPMVHITVPEPETAHGEQPPLSWAKFTAPFRDRNFRILCIVAGVSLLSINISLPFFAPMITSPRGVNAPYIWLGIMFAISQLTWVLVIPFWGTLIDRFNAKSVVMIGMLYPLTYIGYIFLTADNYVIVLPVIAIIGGLLSPAFYEGLNQIMLSLLPRKNRTVYTAWYWGMLGTIQALGPIFGGVLLQSTGTINIPVMVTIGGIIVSFLIFDSIRIGKEMKFTRAVTMASSPGVVKAYFNIPVLAKSKNRAKVEKALKEVKNSKASIALDEIIIRLEDADEEVREEAIRALGRIGGVRAVEVLIEYLTDPDSMIKTECARTLGRMRAKEAIPALIEALESDDEKLVEAAVRALGNIESVESSEALLNLIRGQNSLRVRATSAEVMSKRVERILLLQEILDMYGETKSRIMGKQLAIAIGNILGKPGEFYQFVTGTAEAREIAVQTLFRDIRRNLKKGITGKFGILSYILSSTLPRIIDSYESENYAEAFRLLNVLLLQLIYRHIGGSVDSDRLSVEQLDALYRAVPRLYAAYVVMRWLQNRYAEQDQEYLEQDILLLLFPLKFYRVGEELVD